MDYSLIKLKIGCFIKQPFEIVWINYTTVVCGWFVKNFSIACFVSSRRRCWNSLTQLETVETISRAAWLDFFSITTGFPAGFTSLFLITFIFAFAVIVLIFTLPKPWIFENCMNPILFEVKSNSLAFPLSNPNARLWRVREINLHSYLIWKFMFAFCKV